jgi:hypothetical protein
VTDDHQSGADDRSDRVRDVSDIDPWARGGAMSNIPIIAPSPEAAGGTVVDAATPRRGSRSSLIVIVALSGIVGLVLVVITLRPWRDSPSTDGTEGTATISIPVTSPAGTLSETVPAVPLPGVVGSVAAEEGSGVAEAQSVFGGPGRQGMSRVTVGGPGLVAVGQDSPARNSEGKGSAAVWTSVDGFSWSRVPHDEAIFGTRGAMMFDVTVGGPGLVAVGASFSDSDAVVWTSVDGITWSRVTDDEAGAGADWSMDKIERPMGKRSLRTEQRRVAYRSPLQLR